MKAILAQPWGGLGDNLQFTTLPKLYHDRGIDFYISTHNVYRNNEIYDFVWKDNPYVRGIIDEPPNVGACAPTSQTLVSDNIISSAEIRHGFSGRGRYPEIYYKPKLIPELQEKSIVDLSGYTVMYRGIGSFYNTSMLKEALEKHIPNNENTLAVRFANISIGTLSTPTLNSIEITSLKQYADIIYSCKAYYCLYSGGNIMASAIKHKYDREININTFLYGTLEARKKIGCYVFDNVNYIEII